MNRLIKKKNRGLKDRFLRNRSFKPRFFCESNHQILIRIDLKINHFRRESPSLTIKNKRICPLLWDYLFLSISFESFLPMCLACLKQRIIQAEQHVTQLVRNLWTCFWPRDLLVYLSSQPCLHPSRIEWQGQGA